ncbi:hypothetical protein [Thalassotalea profundi]|uniref:DUF3278 domain-containing protein n=1 Tax=Thalassotalea profundi TaxID=2036687 RepID=A0ABQ3IWF1_9GAMM|nr:hypothetical protein [Thalassotalea profundi]GHE94922.1 hypothetical protein GCM10011501_25500 [Thalassotalea profundi]
MTSHIEHENEELNQVSSDSHQDSELQWAELTKDWQSQTYPKTDIKQLIKQTKRRVKAAKYWLAVDIIGTMAIIIGFFIALFFYENDKATLYYLGFGSIVTSIFCIHTVNFRIRGWRQLSDSPDQAIHNAIKNAESSKRYLNLCKISCYILLPAVNWYLFEVSTLAEKPILPPLLFINVFVAGMWGASHYYLVKRKKEIKQLKSFL